MNDGVTQFLTGVSILMALVEVILFGIALLILLAMFTENVLLIHAPTYILLAFAFVLAAMLIEYFRPAIRRGDGDA